MSSKTASISMRYVAKEKDPFSSHSLILAKVGGGYGRRLLDVGSAQGVLAERFTQRGFEVTCIEGDSQLAAMAQSRCHKVICADLEGPLPQLEGRFDVIVYGDILEHLKNPLDFFRAFNQYLTPTGIVIVSVPNIAHLFVRLSLLVGRFEYMECGILDRTHLRFFTLASFRKFLSTADVITVEICATPVPLYLVWPACKKRLWLQVLHHINATLSSTWKTMFAYQFVAVAQQKVKP